MTAPMTREELPVTDPLREALEEIAGLTKFLRQGGPDPMDLQGLSDALDHATDLAHAALAVPNDVRGVAQTSRIDAATGAGSNCEELLTRADTYLVSSSADGRGSSLLIMELAEALRASTNQGAFK